jgi:hypothetical protein
MADDEFYVVIDPAGQTGRKYVHSKIHKEVQLECIFLNR